MTLDQVQRALAGEGFQTTLEAATEELPLDRLLVAAAEDAAAVLELLFIPAGDEVENVDLLQLFCPIPVDGEPAADELARLIVRLNVTLPLVGFGYQRETGTVYFRYVLVVPRSGGEGATAAIVETVWLVLYLVDRYGGVVQSVAAGELTAAEALA